MKIYFSFFSLQATPYTLHLTLYTLHLLYIVHCTLYIVPLYITLSLCWSWSIGITIDFLQIAIPDSYR